jgi:dethiobiotin synthetase
LTRRRAGLFITGTDTGVGKTLVACALIRGLRRRGIDAAGMKAVETGVGEGGPLDAIALREAAGRADPLDLVCPQRFPLAAAPAVAAAAAGSALDLGSIHAAFAALAERHECLLVEGAGGLLVPLTASLCTADLARELALPLLVVARARLGTVNHTLLTLEAARARRLEVAGVVISRGPEPISPAEVRNLAHLRERLGGLWLGEIPRLAGGGEPPAGSMDLERILRAAGLPGGRARQRLSSDLEPQP